ncbi:MAG TPA: GGDEF domain-containing protein [Actinomycetota bacterium]|nr:GGDEF domain-containing protein [Actinomycetota bacterium]
MRHQVLYPTDHLAIGSRVRLLVTAQLRSVLEHRSTRFAVVGLLVVAASLSTLIPTPEGVDLAWVFIVPVAISAIAGGLREGLSVAAISALISAFYATAAIGEVDPAFVTTVFVGRGILYGITATVLGAFAEAHQSVQSHLRTLASLDPLTKVSNVSRFYEEIGIMEKGAERFAVLLVDLDDLKVINDRFGHQTGSAAIQRVADGLRGVVRASDCVARFGGDEFVVILKDADRVGASLVVDRLRAALAEKRSAAALDVELTVSAGVALFGEDGATSEELLAAADAAMYLDKRTRKATP